MARLYDIICNTCRVNLDIGAIINPEPERPIPDEWAFEGVFLAKDWRVVGRHSNDIEFLRVLQKFLILHRNHDIQVVPEGVPHMWERIHGGFRPIDPEEVLCARLSPPLDWVAERETWRSKLAQVPEMKEKQ